MNAPESTEQDFDPDEDLFDFDEVSGSHAVGIDDADLDEIFAAFQEEEDGEEDLLLPPEVDVGPVGDPEPVAHPAHRSVEATPLPGEPVPDRPSEPSDPQPAYHADPIAAIAEPGRGQPVAAGASPATFATAPPPVQSRVAPPFPSSSLGRALGTTLLSKSALLILVAVACINGFVAIVALGRTASVEENLHLLGRRMENTADELRTEVQRRVDGETRRRTPLAPPDVDAHPTFERARKEIAKGDYAMARRRLYALLAIVDRLEAPQRAEVEARAHYLVAEALHLEALERMEAAR